VGHGWRARLGASAMIATGLLLALAATLGPLSSAGGEPGGSLSISLPDPVRMIVAALLALSALLLLALQRPRRPREDEPQVARTPPRRSPWAAALLPLLVLLLVAGYLAWSRWAGEEQHPIGRAFAAIADLLDLLAQARKAPTSVPWFDVTVAGLLLLFAIAVFSLMLLVALAGLLERWAFRRDGAVTDAAAADPVAEDLADLRTVSDARDAVVRAWARFERILAGARLPRDPWQTPAEFMRAAAARLPPAAGSVRRLTGLFELARFSDRPVEPTARNAACDCLDDIRSALDQEAAHED
jgi:hypothetical protein